jgi:hypothetical protein
MPDSTVYGWLQQGWIKGHKQDSPPYRWIVYANEADIEWLKQVRHLPLSDRMRQQWFGEKSALAQDNAGETSEKSKP